MTNDELTALRKAAQETVAFFREPGDSRANASRTILALLDEVARITAERDDALLCAEQLRAEVDRLTCERDEARAEVERYKSALSIAVTAIRDVHHDIAGQAQMCAAMEKVAAALATSTKGTP